MATTSTYKHAEPRILRGRGQVGLRDAVRISLGEALTSKAAHISTFIWGLAFGLMSAAWSPPRERPFVITGCFVIAAAIGYGSMIPWRWRVIPRRWPSYMIYPVNGTIALLMGMTVFVATITTINMMVQGIAATLRLQQLQNIGWYALYGFQFPVVGFYITVSTDLQHRSNIQRKEKERFQRLAEQARLVALRSQINPHFFFNALNTIAALIPQRPADAERAVELLATALRPVLTRDQPMMATLEEELRVARAYAEIETLRFGDRCRFEFKVEDEAMACLLPGLSLQPLLENAVRHGAAHYSGETCITTRASCEAGKLCLSITNSPAGSFPEEKGEELTFPGGHALHNIHQRLRLLFGNEAQVQVRKLAEHAAICRMVIPQNGRKGNQPGAD